MSYDDHRLTVDTVRASDNNNEPASPPFPPRTPDRGFSGRSISLGLRCFCGNSLDSKRKSGMFCSIDCARNGTFSSLTTQQHRLPSIGTHLTEALSFKDQPFRAPSTTSDYYDEASPHPRAMARAEQRREERRRRRADPIDMGVHSSLICRSSTCPNMPSSATQTAPPPSTTVPDLVSSHSRSTSNASSIYSFSSSSSLSRVGSTSSHHRQPSSVSVAAAIMEVDGEESFEKALARSTLKARGTRRRNLSGAKSTASSLKSSNSDMRVHDMLDELINMEHSFYVDDHHSLGDEPVVPERVPTPVFTQVQDPQHPPRTPSPVNGASAIVPPAPGGGTERRNSLTHSRPSSSFLHQSSLSESHTALYLATASPSGDERNRRSASPKLSLRRSIQFSPSHAGPVIPPSPRRYDSPSRRRPMTLNPVMDAWRFPTADFNEPYGQDDDDYDMPEPAACLWPRGNSSSLGQSAFPTSRASMNLAELASVAPPRSSVRLNQLLGSSSEEADVDMESEVSDDRSTVRGSVRQSFMSPSASFPQRGW